MICQCDLADADDLLNQKHIRANISRERSHWHIIGACVDITAYSLVFELFRFCHKIFHTPRDPVCAEATDDGGHAGTDHVGQQQFQRPCLVTAFAASAQNVNMGVHKAGE